MREFFERLFGKAAIVGFMLATTRKPKPPAFEVDRCSGRETLLSKMERWAYPMQCRAREFRIFGS